MACLVAQQTKAQAAEKKKKLLWSGNRSGEAAAATWATADLGDASRKEKFLKLMGAKPAEATRAEPKLNTAEVCCLVFVVFFCWGGPLNLTLFALCPNRPNKKCSRSWKESTWPDLAKAHHVKAWASNSIYIVVHMLFLIGKMKMNSTPKN